MAQNPTFDLLTYLPGTKYEAKTANYQKELLPFVLKMKAFACENNALANHVDFKNYTIYCKWAIRQMEYSFFINHLPEIANGLALDTGSGVTPFAYLLAKKGWQTTSTDIEADQMYLLNTYGKEIYDEHVTHLVDDLRNIQFPDASFALVTCVSVLEHLSHIDVPLALSELIRVIKPGGRLIISTDVYPFDHPWIPLNEGAFTANKIELIFSPLAKVCNVLEPFYQLLKKVKQLGMVDLERFWTEHWQEGYWEKGNRGYGAVGMVFDLPKNYAEYSKIIYELKLISQMKGITFNS